MWGGKEVDEVNKSPDFDRFSPAYTSIIFAVLLYLITIRKDMRIVMKIVSVGVLFVVILVFSIVGVGIYSLTNTEYKITSEKTETDYDSDVRNL